MRLMLVIISLVLVLPLPAHAYVGPGLGIGAIGALLGTLFSVFLTVLAIFWYPIKRMIRKFRKMAGKDNDP